MERTLRREITAFFGTKIIILKSILIMPAFKENESFSNRNHAEKPFPIGEYEYCDFTNCDFSNADLSAYIFVECTFDNCNFSLAALHKTAFKDVKFTNCNLLGLNFQDCDPFLLEMNFKDCHLNLVSFFKLKLKGTTFKNCNLQEADFIEADLTDAVFEHCNLSRATFENTILEKADFRTAQNYSINPSLNRMRKARFSKEGIAGLLDQFDLNIE